MTGLAARPDMRIFEAFRLGTNPIEHSTDTDEMPSSDIGGEHVGRMLMTGGLGGPARSTQLLLSAHRALVPGRPTTDTAGMTRDDVLRHLDELGVPYTMITHPPVMTVQDAESHWAALPAIHTKNLFLKDAGGALWLVSAPTTRQIDLKALPKLIGAKRLSFGSADLLLETLGTRPGSVSPLSMVNAAPGCVTLILDAALGEAPAIGMHPLDNTATIAMGYADLVRVLAAFGHGVRLVTLGL